MSKKLVQQQFGANAAAYATSSVHAKGASLARLVELVQPQRSWRVLDVARRAGHTAFTFAPHVANVVASDITPEMLDVARDLAREKGLANVDFEPADAEELPFAGQQFDLVTCRIAPHHFPDIHRFLTQAHRVLKSGGILAVVDNVVPGSRDDDPSGEEQRAAGVYVNAFEKLRDRSHGRCLSLDEWRAAYAQADFTLLHDELALKQMTFESWAGRMQKDDAILDQLREMLLDAPPAVAAFLRPEVQDDEDVIFYLTEAILIGQKA